MGAADDDAVTRGWVRAAAGDVAADVALELAAPLADLRDRLALLVDRLDRHVAQSTGPQAYPWKSVQALRQDLASAYLESMSFARLSADLSATLGALGAPAEEVDVERHVEAGVHLARHRIGPRTELLVDLAAAPPVRAPVGELVLAVARMVGACAFSADRADRASLSVRTRVERDAGGACVVISAVDNGGGAPAAAAELVRTIGPWAREHGGVFDGTSPDGQGSAFELRLPVLAGS